MPDRRLAIFTRSVRAAALCLAIMVPAIPSHAAEIDGVRLPDTMTVGGKTVRLNGYGLRTYSIASIHIYVAALYSETPSTSAEALLRSPETRVLTVVFKHDVDAKSARESWRKGFAANCLAPCKLDSADVEKFVSEVPDMRTGDTYQQVYTATGVTISLNGRLIGTIDKPMFAQAMLATFLGPNPGSTGLKQGLLQGHP